MNEQHESGSVDHDPKPIAHRADALRAIERAPGSLHTRPFGPTAPPDGLTPAFTLGVLRRWWKWALPLGFLLAVGTGVAIVRTHVPTFQAKALITIEDATPFIAFPTEAQTQRSTRYVETQIELLKSPVVIAPVLARPEIAAMAELRDEADPIEYLISNLSIKQVGKSELYDVRYVSSSAKDAANVVNAIVAEYLILQSDEEFRRTQRVIDVLEEERLRRSDEVDRLRSRVVELAKEVTGRDPFGQGALTNPDMALSPLGAHYQSLTELDVRREVLKAELQALRDAPALSNDDAAVAGLLEL